MVVLWVTSAIGLLVVAPLVIFLASRVIEPARECARYADDISIHGLGITAALEPVPALLDTRTAVGDIGTNAGAYVGALRQLVSPGATS
jgi:hypothetical protein